MPVTLHAQAIITVDETARYLQDQGIPSDDFDLLKMHINAITAQMLLITARDRLHWIDADEIVEYRDGYGGAGSNEIWTANAPIRKLVSVVLMPFSTTGTATITGPTEPALSNDDLFFDPEEGIIVLKRRNFPEGRKTTKITYEAGFYDQDEPSASDPADPDLLGLKLIAFDGVATKWKRYQNQRHGVSSESKKETTVTYTRDDFDKGTIKELRRYRRTLFA